MKNVKTWDLNENLLRFFFVENHKKIVQQKLAFVNIIKDILMNTILIYSLNISLIPLFVIPIPWLWGFLHSPFLQSISWKIIMSKKWLGVFTISFHNSCFLKNKWSIYMIDISIIVSFIHFSFDLIDFSNKLIINLSIQSFPIFSCYLILQNLHLI